MQYRALFLACCVALAFGCDDGNTSGDDDGLSTDENDASTDAGGDGTSGKGAGGDDDDGNGSSGSGSHGAHGGSGAAGDDDDGNAGSAAAGGGGKGNAGGSSGTSGNGDAGASDAGTSDGGIDSGMTEIDASEPEPEPDPCGDNVECAGGCCSTGQVCKTQATTQMSIDFPNIHGATRNVVVGSTVTFTWSADHDHDVYALPNSNAFAMCNFDSAQQLTESSGYVWTAPSAGNFYFGCSVSDHCSSDGMKLHVIVAPAQACGAP
jgi:plastocyanin